MTEKALGKIAVEAEQRWPLLKLEVLHRVGALEPGEPIVFVGAASAHRQAAFEAVCVCDGLPEDAGAVLEEGKYTGWAAVGGGARQ